MDTVSARLYEGMFLVDSGEAAADWQGINDAIALVLTKNGAQVVSQKKWDERRLCYDVGGKGRGTYILVYFNCDPAQITAIEREVQLSERMMRVMILRTDKLTQEEMEKPTPAMVMEASALADAAKAAARVEAAKAAALDRAEKDAAAKAESDSNATDDSGQVQEEPAAEEVDDSPQEAIEAVEAQVESPEEEPAAEEVDDSPQEATEAAEAQAESPEEEPAAEEKLDD